MNGKTVEVDNTDAEGRLILSGLFFSFIPLRLDSDAFFYTKDALYYTSSTFKPHTLIDVATLTRFVSFINYNAYVSYIHTTAVQCSTQLARSTRECSRYTMLLQSILQFL